MGAMVPVVAPDGSSGEVPQQNLQAAIQAGGKPGVWMLSPEGDRGIVPRESVAAAVKSGGVPFQTRQAMELYAQGRQNQAQKQGALGAIGSDIEGVAKGLFNALADVGSADIPYSKPSLVDTAQQVMENEQARKQEGRSLPYRALANTVEAAAPVVNVRGMEEAANQGDTAGVLGHAAFGAAMAASPLAAEGIGNAVDRATMPTEAEAHANIINALDTPPGKAGIRAQQMDQAVQVAHNDLAEIQRQNPVTAKGAEAFHQTAEAIEKYKQELWQEGHQPAIDRNSEEPTDSQRLVQAGKSAIPPEEETASPGEDTAASKWLDEVAARPRNVRQLDNFIRRLNNDLRSKQAETYGDAGIAVRQAVVKAARGLLDDTLEGLGENGVRAVNQRWGALDQIQDRMEERAVQLARAAAKKGPIPDWVHAYGFLHPGAALLPVSLGAGLRLSQLAAPEPGGILRSGLTGLERIGLQQPAPELVLTPPPGHMPLPETEQLGFPGLASPDGWMRVPGGYPMPPAPDTSGPLPTIQVPRNLYFQRALPPGLEHPTQELVPPIPGTQAAPEAQVEQAYPQRSGVTRRGTSLRAPEVIYAGPGGKNANIPTAAGANPTATSGPAAANAEQVEPTGNGPAAATQQPPGPTANAPAQPVRNDAEHENRILSVDSAKARGWASKASDQTKSDVIAAIDDASTQGVGMKQIFEQFGASMLRTIGQDAGIAPAELQGMVKGDALTHQGQVHLGQILRSWLEKGQSK